MEDDDDAPLEQLVWQCLLRPIRDQYMLVSRCTRAVLMDELRLHEHCLALRRFFLMVRSAPLPLPSGVLSLLSTHTTGTAIGLLIPRYCSKRCAYCPGPLDLGKLSAQLTQVKRSAYSGQALSLLRSSAQLSQVKRSAYSGQADLGNKRIASCSTRGSSTFVCAPSA
jgi:hypothetical protein